MKNRLPTLAGCVLLLPLAGCLSWPATAPPFDADAEDRAVKAIEKLHGIVTRDEQAPGKPVVRVNLGRLPVKDADLKELAALKGLQELDLSLTLATDAGLKGLAALTELQELNLSFTKVTDAGLKELAPLKGLQWLDLRATQMTDAGLKELAALKGLRMLDLRHTGVTDAGVAELKKALPDCEIVR